MAKVGKAAVGLKKFLDNLSFGLPRVPENPELPNKVNGNGLLLPGNPDPGNGLPGHPNRANDQPSPFSLFG